MFFRPKTFFDFRIFSENFQMVGKFFESPTFEIFEKKSVENFSIFQLSKKSLKTIFGRKIIFPKNVFDQIFSDQKYGPTALFLHVGGVRAPGGRANILLRVPGGAGETHPKPWAFLQIWWPRTGFPYQPRCGDPSRTPPSAPLKMTPNSKNRKIRSEQTSTNVRVELFLFTEPVSRRFGEVNKIFNIAYVDFFQNPEKFSPKI